MKLTKKLLNLSAMLFAFAVTPAFAADFEQEVIRAESVYSPKGFDSNDDTQIILSGALPNVCYKDVKTTSAIHGNSIHITLTAMRDQRPDRNCLQVLVPYLEVVSVGSLKKGSYKVFVNPATRFEARGDITINKATETGVDDHVYADIHNIRQVAGSRVVVLEGILPSACLALDRVETISNDKATYSILPILKRVGEYCPARIVPFKYRYTVPSELKAKKVLLHVRSMRGRSVNMLFKNR